MTAKTTKAPAFKAKGKVSAAKTDRKTTKAKAASDIQQQFDAMTVELEASTPALLEQLPVSKKEADRLPVHPTNAALIGGVIGAAWHFLG